MFIRRADFVAGQTELGGLRASREVLTRELAIRQKNVDWLTNHVNRLEHERAELLQRVLDIRLPVPVIAREAMPHPDLAQALGIGRPIEERDRPAGEVPGVANAQLGLSSFEDMGDDAAERLGVGHDLAGNVKFS